MSDWKSFLGLANRARKIISGEELVLKEVRSGKAKLVLLSEDASVNTTKRITDKTTYYNVPMRKVENRQQLGHAIGRDERVVVAVLDEGFAKKLRSMLDTNYRGEGMSKIRVHEYAKKHNISSKDLMTKLKEMNIEVSNHMTMLDDEVVNKLDNEYQAEKPSVADEFEVEEKVVRSKKNSNKKKKKAKETKTSVKRTLLEDNKHKL